MRYSTDLTLRQRDFIFEKFPEIFKTKSKADMFEILNALFFLIKTGCQWKLLPKDFPRWRTVYEFYRKWASTGFFDRLTQELNAVARISQGKSAQPTAGVIDSRSVRSGLAHSEKGVDGGKRIKGIKRHLAVDSNGFPLTLVTSRANVHDSKGAIALVIEAVCKYPTTSQTNYIYDLSQLTVAKLHSPRPIAVHLRPLVSVTMEPHRSLTARTHLHNA